MTTRFAKFEFRRGQAGSTEGEKTLGRAEVALYDGPFVTDDVIDDIFCKRWNLPPPKLIISVTGSAQDWDKATAPAVAASSADPGDGARASKKDDPKAALAKANGVREQAAITRFIKNCVYASAVDSRCCWIIGGGSNAGVMRLLGDARRLLGGWGDDVRLGSALVPVIGVGVASKMKYYDTTLKSMPRSDVQQDIIALNYQPGVFESCKEDLFKIETSAEGKAEKVTLYVPDPSHSHLLFLGSESGKWGDEVKQRIEAEEYFSAKFKAPIVYIVLGGGPITVKLVQDCIQKEAFTVVVNGSGRAADVIAEYAKNRCIYDQNHTGKEQGGSPLFWELHGNEINGKPGEEDKDENKPENRHYRLQECTAKYINIVNSKYLAIFDPETTSYDDMCTKIRGVTYASYP